LVSPFRGFIEAGDTTKGTIMKHRNIFSIAVILGTLLWPSFAAAALGQQGGRRLIADTRVVRLGVGQILRITINDQAGNDTLNVRFRRMYYVGSANGGVWKSSVVVQDTSDPITLASNEAASTDISQGSFDAVRGEVIIRGYTGTSTVNGGVLFQIINTATGEVVSVWDDTDIVH
jgi:hypothetical protein